MRNWNKSRSEGAKLPPPGLESLSARGEDAGAAYPIRIKPTFSGANRVSLNPR